MVVVEAVVAYLERLPILQQHSMARCVQKLLEPRKSEGEWVAAEPAEPSSEATSTATCVESTIDAGVVAGERWAAGLPTRAASMRRR